MNRVAYVLTATVLLAACSRQTAVTSASATSEVPAKKAAHNSVTLSIQAQQESGVITAPVREQALPEVIRSTARLTNNENETWRVGAVAEGRIVRILANQGDVVKKNQLLAQMHSHDIHEARAEYKKAKADLARDKGVVEYARNQRDRAKRLYDLKAGSLAILEQKETELRNAETDVRNAEVEIERTVRHLVEVLHVPVEESDVPPPLPDGEDNDLIPVKAPAGGVILSRNVTPGTVVNPASDMFLISDLTSLWAIAEVSEEYLGKLRLGMPVKAFVQAYPNEPFLGRIGKLGEVLNASTRTIQVRVELPNSRGRLKPEMYATTEIQIGSGMPGLVIPSEAVQDVRGQNVVFVKTEPGRFEVRPVRAGRTLDNSFEILSGVTAGEEIAVQSAFILKSEFLKASMASE
jgi:multidrug efflux pump subunit AcrA (membrane-fusion protein)